MSWNEKEIVDACIRKDGKAQESLYIYYSTPMFRICLGYARNEEDAKDILQEGFIKVFEQIATFRFESGLYAWVRKIFVHTAIDFYRKQLRKSIITIDFGSELETQLTGCIDERADYTFYQKLIAEMPIGYKLVFNLFAIEGYSHKEIAEITGLSEGTSKSQLARARKYLQNRLKIEQEIYTFKRDAYEQSIGRLVSASF